MKDSIIAVIALVTIFQLVVQPGQAVTCGQVDSALAPCVSYLTGRGNTPSDACCTGVDTVKALAQTTADKKTTCACVKAAATRYADLKDMAAQSLPSKCHVQIDIPVSRNIDCDKIA